jgi:hypothetical protein
MVWNQQIKDEQFYDALNVWTVQRRDASLGNINDTSIT